VTSVVEKRLGALPVVSEFTRRLDLAGIVDEVCPGGASALVTHGQVIEALVANRLTAPAPLVRVGDWARTCTAWSWTNSARAGNWTGRGARLTR
jgi:hypothetical protein